MVKTIKLDKNNYFYDTLRDRVVKKYDPNNEDLQLVLQLENGSKLIVDNSMIKQEYGGQIIVQHNDDKYIINDGFMCELIKAGYIVYKNYDVDRIRTKTIGIETREKLIKAVRKVICNLGEDDKYSNYSMSGNETKLSFETRDFSYIFVIDTVNNLVNKNQQRKANSLAFYPFNKDMDKYGTLYLCVFAQKKTDHGHPVQDKYKVSDQFIEHIINELGIDYHFIGQNTKSRLIYCKGI